VPSIPTCTLPGQQGSNPPETVGDSMIDNAQVISSVIEDTLSDIELGEGVTYD